MNAQEIAKLLRGKPAGGGNYLVCCPAHKDRTPSLSIKDGRQSGRLLVNCQAGCDGAAVIAEFKRLGYLGAVSDGVKAYEPQAHDEKDEELRQKSTEWARSVWHCSQSAEGTIVEDYLRSRGYDGPVPPTLRFHPLLKHPYERDRYPGMVAAVGIAPDRYVKAIHRTYLKSDGSGKADIDNAKAMLGQCKGGAARLAPLSGNSLIVGEGIETTFSAMQLLGLPGWAGLTASGIEGMILPLQIRSVIVCADRDKPTDLHPNGHGFESAERAALRWRADGREVEIRLPSDGLKDFNDVLCHSKKKALAFGM